MFVAVTVAGTQITIVAKYIDAIEQISDDTTKIYMNGGAIHEVRIPYVDVINTMRTVI